MQIGIEDETKRIKPSLTKKLLLQHNNHPKQQQQQEGNQTKNNHSKFGKSQPQQRISKDAIDAAGELLRHFILEARHRASIEAEFECELENHDERKDGLTTRKRDQIDQENDNEHDNEEYGTQPPSRKKHVTRNKGGCTIDEGGDTPTVIKAEHVMKIAAELLMDFA